VEAMYIINNSAIYWSGIVAFYIIKTTLFDPITCLCLIYNVFICLHLLHKISNLHLQCVKWKE
jgi:hypothetical protein